MSVGIVAGEDGVFAPGRAEQRAADAAEGELAGGVGCVGRWGVGEGALELADALAECGVGEVEEPADFLAGVAGEGEQGGEAEGWGQVQQWRQPPPSRRRGGDPPPPVCDWWRTIFDSMRCHGVCGAQRCGRRRRRGCGGRRRASGGFRAR